MAKKMTQKEMFAEVINVLEGKESAVAVDDMVTFLGERIAKLDKKANSKTPTKTQKENEEIKDILMGVIGTEGKTVSEIQTLDERLANLSNQKVSALVRQLVIAGKVTRTMDGKKTKFALS